MTRRSVPAEDLGPLDAGLFTFHGFGGLAERVERRLRRAGLRHGDPTVEVVENALFAPERHPRETRLREDVGGDGRADAITSPDHADDRPAETPDDVDADVVYLGWLFDGYGHVLLESLARTWVLPEIDPSVRLVFHRPNPARLTPKAWALRILAAFGVPPDRLFLLDRPTRFRRAIIPEPLFALPNVAFARAAMMFQDVARRVAAGTTPSAQPLYLSRRLLPSPQRPMIGEGELEDVLRENGFLVAHPETMTFEDQVRLVNAHTDIFTGAGSTAHNVLFALQRPRLHLLTNEDRVSANFFLCSALAEAPTTFVNCLGLGHRPPLGNPMLRRTPEVVATATLVEYLDARGLLKTRARAALAGRDPAHRRAYDEAWFYARVRAGWKGADLPEGVEREAVAFARQSWPVSLALARYDAQRRIDRLDAMARQFASLVAADYDVNRLARYREDVEDSMAIIIGRSGAATGRLVAGSAVEHVLADRVAGGAGGSPPRSDD